MNDDKDKEIIDTYCYVSKTYREKYKMFSLYTKNQSDYGL